MRYFEEDKEDDDGEDWLFCEGCGCYVETAKYRSWSDHAWCDDCAGGG